MARCVRFSRDDLAAAIESSRSYSETLRKLGYRPAGGNHVTLKKYAAIWEISTDHFDPYWASRGGRPDRIALSEILVEGSSYPRGHLKNRLLSEGLKRSLCELCGQGTQWQGREMALILDHINGTGDDNRLENLRIVCPNCAATFETHCGRKNRRPRVERKCLLCGATFLARYRSHRYCSLACGARAPKVIPRGDPRSDRRKVERPSRAELGRDLERLSYRAVGRKYGVSDNAVRKWVRQYEREAR